MQVNMENNSDHFLSHTLEFYNYEEKVDLNDISVEHSADSFNSPAEITESRSSVECPVCFVKFTHKNSLNRHMQRFHDVKPPRSHLQPKSTSNVPLPECSECGIKFTRKSNLIRHVKKLHELSTPSENPELPKIFKAECNSESENNPEYVIEVDPFPVISPLCVETTKTEVDPFPVMSPLCVETMKTEVDPFPVISSLCVDTIKTESTFSPESVAPSEKQLPENSSNSKSESSTKKKSKVLCTECGVWFSSPFNLRRHQNRLHAVDGVPAAAEATAAVKMTLIKDTALTELLDPKLLLRTCCECQVSFSSPFNLRRHMQRAHPELYAAAAVVYSCRKKSGSTENRLFCPLCPEPGISFSTPFNLRRHMKRIHPAQDVVAAADQIKKEVGAGDSDASLSCPQSPKDSPTPSDLRRFMQKPLQLEEVAAEVDEPMIDTAEILKCPLCEYRENRLNLYVHFNLVHGVQVVVEYQVFDSEVQLDEWLSQISPEAQFMVRKSDANRMVISCSQPNHADEFCPAEMMILTESGRCTVHYVKTHVHVS